ncbi:MULTISPECIES: hypothetical protein [unclassified Tenacibaculum]|uniref:hypothetical protein n=1 Tax=unclassified Tenacibaculum TaxID=2635139 RepID=UPI001F1D6B74|nr:MULTISPECIES: hypothetical protein [unclassified Tenacibaculum]MCF2875551.1 hypothetical protein [Tenacibaculum sp. Cn5-1]MCF2935627.1 hypothetical protein [Tenacibaculum sp. Cn5-34]MCG7512187.1 hypothetical protein [Tenacibaculum sp. Cn5-46]
MYSDTVICIPVKWESRTEIVEMILKSSKQQYLFAGQILMNTISGENFELEICEKDERIPIAFAFAGKVNGIKKDEINEVKRHNSVIYLTKRVESLKAIEELANITSLIVESGGYGVKIESAGLAFSKDQWLMLQKNKEIERFYGMFVCNAVSSILSGLYSCGMHNLLLKDTIVSGLDYEKGQELIRAFNLYQLFENPKIIEGQTFSIDGGASVYVVSEELNQPNKGEELFENLYGMWRLTAK